MRMSTKIALVSDVRYVFETFAAEIHYACDICTRRTELSSTCGFVITAHQVCIIHSGAGAPTAPDATPAAANPKIYPAGPAMPFVRSFSLLIYFLSSSCISELSRGVR